jgi:hypothetical protein
LAPIRSVKIDIRTTFDPAPRALKIKLLEQNEISLQMRFRRVLKTVGLALLMKNAFYGLKFGPQKILGL